MRLKSYFSGTVEAAMQLAAKELGEDALLIHAKPASPETRYLGAYEVVFGVVSEPASRAETKHHQPQPPVKGGALADPTVGRIVALIGPPGAGKTTTLVKLAVRFGLRRNKTVQFLTADVNRIAAADQIRTLAAILGAGCEVADSAAALGQLIEQHRSKELLLIDTPGFARRETKDAAAIARVIQAHDQIDTHLVLPAFMRESDLMHAVEQYSVFHPKKLLFTRLDETSDSSAIAHLSQRWSLPVSFLGVGQQIPDDLEAASSQWLGGTNQLIKKATA